MIPLDARMQAAHMALMNGLGHGVPIPGRTDVTPGMGLMRPGLRPGQRRLFPRPVVMPPVMPPPIMPTHLAALRALYG